MLFHVCLAASHLLAYNTGRRLFSAIYRSVSASDWRIAMVSALCVFPGSDSPRAPNPPRLDASDASPPSRPPLDSSETGETTIDALYLSPATTVTIAAAMVKSRVTAMTVQRFC